MHGIFTYIWLIFLVNVGKYTSPMDSMKDDLKRKNNNWPWTTSDPAVQDLAFDCDFAPCILRVAGFRFSSGTR